MRYQLLRAGHGYNKRRNVPARFLKCFPSQSEGSPPQFNCELRLSALGNPSHVTFATLSGFLIRCRRLSFSVTKQTTEWESYLQAKGFERRSFRKPKPSHLWPKIPTYVKQLKYIQIFQILLQFFNDALSWKPTVTD